MKNLQVKYKSYLDEVCGILQGVGFDTTKQKELSKAIDEVRLIAPVIGGFSAGKSTFINSFLKNQILSVNITPETALATELIYDKNERFEAVFDDDKFDKFEISKSKDINGNSSKYEYVKAFVDNENLKNIEPLILVDMPGFDSPVSLHNKAILNYLSKGKFFIVLISVEEGGITNKVMRELQNISELSKDFIVCVSKANLRSGDDVERIKSHIKSQLQDYFDYDKEVVVIGLDDGDNLGKILSSIDSKELFKSIVLPDLKSDSFAIESAIATQINTLQNDKEASDKAIRELESAVVKLQDKKESAIADIQAKYSSNTADSIVRSIERDLYDSADNLANLAVSGAGFESELNDIIQNTLIRESRRKLNSISSDIVGDFKFELKGLNLANFAIDDTWLEKVSSGIESLLNNAMGGLNSLSIAMKENAEKAGRVYKALTTILSIATNVVNPVLELVVVFLPEIISFFTKNSKKDEIKNQIISSVIPKIKGRLKDEINAVFGEQISNIVAAASDEFEAQLTQKRDEIAKAVSLRSENANEIENKISALKDAKERLARLSSENLY
ncbi:dynamin family protein [Campylobacter sp. JMF_01 NE2]|uniref:dynamin family protein n=1 Tax=unclassified Campylobacter TaxID=2593542 RepID=UPI0022E9EE9B|nr:MULTISPECIES: dynamin family protein [unclassified Campylobacter]MDA3053022.1 dynamin family protein [Campylobacter sp. JMF_03 NE3]MDA3067353.1 dynamin family protein [Campylobacter sp. JMF_01 NE2]